MQDANVHSASGPRTGTAVPTWRSILADLWPLNRVHVGPAMSEACARLANAYADARVLGYGAGETSGSWRVPPAWEVRAGRLTGPDGRVLADWTAHPLSLFTYSPAFTGTVSRQVLEEHLLSDPSRPHAIPFHFRNQYRHWAPEWGFCLPDVVRRTLPDGNYRVEIDTRFVDGRLQMVEQVHRGERSESLLLVGHLDHPAICNDGLVGCLAGHEVVTRLAGRPTRLTYRMLSTVEIIGSVFYAEREARAAEVRHALVVATAGARAPLLYQTTSGGTSFLDVALPHVLSHAAPDAKVKPFRSAFGNDEVAFDVAGVNIPCGSLARWPFPEYHTSDDTPDAVDDANFEEMVRVIMRAIDILERNARLVARFSGLPCLSNPEIDLYLSPPTMSGIRQDANGTARELLARLPDAETASALGANGVSLFALMNHLPAVSGRGGTTFELAERAGVPFAVADVYTDMWVEKGLLAKEWVNPFQAS